MPWLHEAPVFAIRLFRQLCDAISYIHEQTPPIIHRDLKPQNVLVGSEPRRVVVADFGIARPDNDDRVHLTRTHEIVGTKYYRAPEVMMELAATVRSDVYSLGRTLEWLVTGREPNETSPRPVPRGSELTDGACHAISDFLTIACAMNPSQRFSTVAEMKLALPDLRVATVTELTPSPEPASDAERRAGTILSSRQPVPTDLELRKLLAEYHGNIAAVGHRLGKARMQIHRWMKGYSISPDEYR